MSGLRGALGRALAGAEGRRRWVLGAAVLAGLGVAGVAAALLLGGGSEAERPAAPRARPVTGAEAARLAVMRFQNYRGTGVHFRTQVSSAQGPLSLEGDVDYRRELGYAKVSGAGSAFTLAWNERTLLAWPDPTPAAAPPERLPARRPARRALAPSRTAVDVILALLLGLGRDRPDNAQLIRRNGAKWLRRDQIGAARVDVMQGPRARGGTPGSGAALRYWLDASGRLRRVDASLGGGPSTTRIELDAAGFMSFPRLPQLTA